MAIERNRPEFFYWEGEPAGVMLNLDDYEEMLRRMGDAKGLEMVARIRSKPQTRKSP